MIFSCFFAAVRQIGDPAFRRVLLLGLALTFLLLVAVYAAFLALIQWIVPETIEIPLVGPVGGLDTLLSLGSFLFMIALSIVLMVPVAAAFTGLFLEDVAAAVEARHYPHLPAPPGAGRWDAFRDSVNFLGVLVVVNLFAFVLFFFVGPFGAVLFWAMNGFLLGREYFQIAAMRRFGRQGAKDLRSRHALTIWAAGTLMAAPLSVPLVNLLIPVLGAATFTHLVHRLHARG